MTECIGDGERHARTLGIVGARGLERLRRAHVTVVGLGGVGGACAEALARTGVGALTLIDGDAFEPSNLNRQQGSCMDALGKPKAEVVATRIRAIDPGIVVTPIHERIDGDHMSLLTPCDALADAVDDLTAKVLLAQWCKALGIPCAASMGAGNRVDPSAFRLTDIYKTTNDPLARAMRPRYRAAGIEKLQVVCSTEKPLSTGQRTPSSIAFVPPAAGLLLASAVVGALLGEGWASAAEVRGTTPRESDMG